MPAEFVSLKREDGSVVCERCLVATRPLQRMRGLLGRRELPEGEGILLRHAGSIHTFFMRFPIDAVFLDREHTVVGVASDVRPWQAAGRRGAKAVLELAAGEAERRGVEVGQRLEARRMIAEGITCGSCWPRSRARSTARPHRTSSSAPTART